MHNLQRTIVRYEMKRRVKSDLTEEDLVLLKIPKQLEKKGTGEFKRFHEREFRYRGEMYDVVKQEDHRGETWYTCIHDVRESHLFKRLDELLSLYMNHDRQQKKQNHFTVDLFGKDYILCRCPVIFFDDRHASGIADYDNFFSEVFPGKLLRPPRL